MKPKQIVLLIILAVAIAALVGTALQSDTTTNFKSADKNPDQTYHVVGYLLKDKPMEYDPVKDPNYFSFYLEDEEGTVRKVVSLEPKQQDFERAEKVNMYGKSDGDVFRASKVIPKCPSKYKDEQINKEVQASRS